MSYAIVTTIAIIPTVIRNSYIVDAGYSTTQGYLLHTEVIGNICRTTEVGV